MKDDTAGFLYVGMNLGDYVLGLAQKKKKANTSALV